VTIRISWSAVLASIVVLGVLGGAFGIAWGLVEWRAADKEDMSSKLEVFEGDVQMLEDDIGDLDNRVSRLETPAPIANRDIQELYARTDYQACIRDADVKLSDAEWALAESYRAYLAGNKSYSEYEADYQAYAMAYDRYDVETDTCWAAYSDASPEASPYEWW
jgi:hypothetical protein